MRRCNEPGCLECAAAARGFDASDYERPPRGTTRAVLRFEAATVSVLLTRREAGGYVGSAVVDTRAEEGVADVEAQSAEAAPQAAGLRHYRTAAPTMREAWADLATWIGRQLGGVS